MRERRTREKKKRGTRTSRSSWHRLDLMWPGWHHVWCQDKEWNVSEHHYRHQIASKCVCVCVCVCVWSFHFGFLISFFVVIVVVHSFFIYRLQRLSSIPDRIIFFNSLPKFSIRMGTDNSIKSNRSYMLKI